MNAEVLRHLRCPVCGRPLAAVPADQPRVGALRCAQGHNFDVARQGYVNLNTGRTPHTGDSADMVGARAGFLAAGHYDFIAAALTATARREAPHSTAYGAGGPGGQPLIMDAGAGTGRYLAAVLDALPETVGLALDVSKPALRRAARAHPRAGAALCDTWGPLPLPDQSVSLLLNVFAPRNGPEFCRVLQPGGRLLVVTPAADHLRELVQLLDLLQVDPVKADRVADSLAGRFQPVHQSVHRRRLRLSRREVQTLVRMGPSAWHSDPRRLAVRLAGLPEPVPVTASVRLAAYRPGPVTASVTSTGRPLPTPGADRGTGRGRR